MELRSILSAGVIRFVESKPPPGGLVLGQDVVRELVGKYKFWESPSGPTEFNLDDTANGAVFRGGAFDGVPINVLRLYRRGIAAESAEVSTDMLLAFVDDVMQTGVEALGLAFSDLGDLKRGFNSSVEVQMSETFGRRLEALEKVGAFIDDTLAQTGVTNTSYQFGALSMQPGDGVSPIVPQKFTIERRVNHEMHENVYFSQAPLATAEHLKALQMLDDLF